MIKRVLILLFILLSCFFHSQGQQLDNLRRKELILNSQAITIDSLSVIPGTLRIFYPTGNEVPQTLYSVNFGSATLTISEVLLSDGLHYSIEYRVFPMLFEGDFYRRDYDESLSPDSLMGRETQRYAYGTANEPLFGEGIQTGGSITRGISFGNNQSVTMNSGMNIQLSGELESGLKVEGAISDQSIPLQPEGTTARIEEFDRIYLKVYRDNFAIEAGDIDIKSNDSGPLINITRNVQGLAYNGVFEIGSGRADTLRVTTAFAAPNGKFSRNSFNGQEGNQGPYRLSGAMGEQHIIIIAGSERVYVDGVLLQRGDDRHYTMEYNLAELTFTHNMPINRNSRIIVEFEYSERSYARFNTYANVHRAKGGRQWHISVFSEQDGKNQPYDQELTEAQKRLLASIGDNLDLAFYAQADSVPFDPEKILYQKTDTVEGGIPYTIYRHSVNPENAHYRLSFSYVGQGKGNYKPDFGQANGKVYRWVAPENGSLQGSYEPVKRLVAPQKRQVFTAGIAQQMGKGSMIRADYALSNTDLNTFSTLNSDDDIGHSFLIAYSNRIVRDSLTAWGFGTHVHKTTDGYRNIDRIREAEFERDWSIARPLDGGGEQLIGLWTDFKKDKSVYSRLSFDDFRLSSGYQGDRISAMGWQKGKTLNTSWNGMASEVRDSVFRTRFNKLKLGASVPVSFIMLSLLGELEQNQSYLLNGDSLLGQSYQWHQAKAMLATPDSFPTKGVISYTFREDYKPWENEKTLVGRSEDLMFEGRTQSETVGNVGLKVGYRIFNPNDSIFKDIGKKEKTLLTRVEYSQKVAKGLLSVSGAYELGSGLETENEYYFFEVPAGQGVYTWIDYNGNGIMELDEFEVAAFSDEARFIRINTPGTNMVRVRTNAFSLKSNLAPMNFLKDKGKFARWIGRFSNQNSFIVSQKNRFDDFWNASNPFVHDEKDTLITGLSSHFRNSLAYNRASRKFGIEYIINRTRNKSIPANGFEIKGLLSHRALVWFGVGQYIAIRIEGELFSSSTASQLFISRNHSIQGQASTTSIKYTGSGQASYEMGYKWKQSENTLGAEQGVSHTLFVQVDLVFPGKASIMAKSSYIANSFEGEIHSPAAYDMLEGLRPGRNATWNIVVRRRLSKVFELEAGYGGRVLSDGIVVHTGTMQARALF